ncbi:MAG: TonB-dependent receptor [Stenotrophobium sp.]
MPLQRSAKIRPPFTLNPAALFYAAAISVFSANPVAAQQADAPAPITASASNTVAPDSNDKAITIAAATATPLPEVTVTANRLNLLGTAETASDGVVTQQELDLTPAYRPGQLLETVPGLIVTIHSGEGKANQYLMRGYNLDHGTDLATFIDGVPINEPTHAHGQGYTDLNILIPELLGGLTYTKGTYHAEVGDFGGVGSVHLSYLDTIPDQVSVTTGVFNFQRLFAGGTRTVAGGNLLTAVELQHYDGPFVAPDDQRKENLVLRYSHGDDDQGYSLTGSIYHGLSTNTTDIPVRAITEGLVANRFGSLDPTDGVNANRENLSYQYHNNAWGDGQLAANVYYFHNQLNLYNNFTHFLFDPVNGDQEDQQDKRHVLGGEASYTLPVKLASIDNEFVLGVLTRYDILRVGRTPSVGRVSLTPAQTPSDPASFRNLDSVHLLSTAVYLQTTTHWTSWFRSVLGVRDDYMRGIDSDDLAAVHESTANGNIPYTNGGTSVSNLVQPKGSLIFTPTQNLELYLSAGRGFHSADLRGVNQTKVPDLMLPNTPLIAPLNGEEAGLRADVRKNLSLTVAVFNLNQHSETVINPDVGSDSPGPSSRRYGYEVNFTYKVRRWLEIYGSYSGDHTRFNSDFDDGTGHLGRYITDAPIATGSLAIYLEDLGPWSGGLEYRYLGRYPLSSGTCADTAVVHDFPNSFPNPGTPASCANAVAMGLTTAEQLQGAGFGEVNMDVNYAFPDGWSTSLGIYNLLDVKNNAAQFTYVDRLKSEVATYPDGRADRHIHPLEPLAARLTISKKFSF